MAKAKSKKSKGTVSAPKSATEATVVTAVAPEKKAVTKAEPSKVDQKSVAKKAPAKTQKKTVTDKKPSVINRFSAYIHNVRAELKRVTWPTKSEVVNSSLVVVGALVFFGVMIYIVDSAIVPALVAYQGLAG
ncbi:MAG: preprotein translocase subunit SecE [Actinobacteria bacterium]|nr:preprotein translocase subunit SecE [Actinomycetota bacterium]